MSSITPNMNLPVPSVNSTPGPEWAQILNEALTLIDQHTHTTGQGVPVALSGLNIDVPLDMGNFAVNNVGYVNLADLDADITPSGVYRKNGDLFFKNSAGDAVRITDGDSITGTSGSIAGLGTPAAASFALNTFTWTYDSSKYAKMSAGDLVVYPYDGTNAYTKSITLKAPTGLEATASYSISLPTANPPSGVEYLSIDSTGAVNHATLTGTVNQVTVAANATAISLSLPATVSTTRFYGASGSNSSPSYSFASASNSGMYDNGSGLGFSVSGSQRLAINSSGAAVTGTLSSSGTLTAPSLTSSSSGVTVTQPVTYSGSGGSAVAHKTSIFTGSLNGEEEITLSTGGTIYGVMGFTQTVNGSNTRWEPMSDFSAGGGRIGYKGASSSVGPWSTASSVRLINFQTGTSLSYRVVVIHA